MNINMWYVDLDTGLRYWLLKVNEGTVEVFEFGSQKRLLNRYLWERDLRDLVLAEVWE